jgi:uncharacterized surface protein with fasciclin (FAS1) repeats
MQEHKQIEMKLKSIALSLIALIGLSFASNAQTTVVDVAVGSPDHTTLVAAVKAAGLVGTLQSAGPFTVFAPVNAAFAKLPAGTVDYLLKPENKATLTKVLTYHVIAGTFDAATVVKAIADAKGSLALKTVSGGTITASVKNGKVVLTDEKGGIATVVATDLKAGNGIVHVIDTVVLPK